MYRFAPSLTGNLSINDLRIALMNYLCAQQAGEHFIVRIEDKDQDEDILDMLALFGISYSQLYYQSNNFKYHLQFASTLLDTKKAFICFCPQEDNASSCNGTCEHLSPEEVINNPLPFVIRMKKSDTTSDSFVIMSTNKYPTSTFASACDDMLQGVTTIIQEEKHLSNATKEEWVRKSLGYEQAMHYVHIPTIQSENTVKWLLDQGFMPEAILNYLLLLGNPAPCEIFYMVEALAWFDIKNISASPTHFDIEKLHFINREHIKRTPDMELSKRMGYACENIGKLAKLYTQEVSTTYEIKQKIDVLFAPKPLHVAFEKEAQLLKELIQKAPYLDTFEAFTAYLLKKSELKEETFLKPLRFILTGCDNGPKLDLLYPLIKNYLKEIVR